ncbi:unnamed protein product [Urochloa decumbens]|uniref:F-box domain-containing protein n=1 Tax=Urochloa decumbens TaxID=240449 RepID=A0ABC9B1J2_9POAL
MDRLPEDVLAGLLGRLDPRSLSVCRCVSGEWRRIVEGRGLLLPRSLHGLFINYHEHRHPHLLSRPGSPAAGSVDGLLDFMPSISWRALVNHCNGLFVYEDGGKYYVCNPATRRWARLPPPRMQDWDRAAGAYLVFDPAASLHYKVVHLPCAPEVTDPNLVEWPPEVVKTDVFSSSTGQWEERQFVREGGAVATVADVLSENEWPVRKFMGPMHRHGEYWKGALYIHCRGSFVIRLSLSDSTYKATKTPTFVEENENTAISINEVAYELGNDITVKTYLGRSKRGIYYVRLHIFQIRVWWLNESGGQMEWVLQHHSDLAPIFWTLLHTDIYINASWIFDDYYSDTKDYESDCDEDDYDVDDSDDEDQCSSQQNSNDIDDVDDSEVDNIDHGSSQGNSDNSDNGYGEDDNSNDDQDHNEWNSDDDYTLKIKNNTEDLCCVSLFFLGFHPQKEIIFLGENNNVVAYHLGHCKAQYLGNCKPSRSYRAMMLESFPYTPCFIDAISKQNYDD